MPKIIIAVGLYFLYVQMRILGTTFGLVAAHTVIALPYVVMIYRPRFMVSTGGWNGRRAAWALHHWPRCVS